MTEDILSDNDMEEVVGPDALQPGDVIVEVQDEPAVTGSSKGPSKGKGTGRKLDDAFVISPVLGGFAQFDPRLTRGIALLQREGEDQRGKDGAPRVAQVSYCGVARQRFDKEQVD